MKVFNSKQNHLITNITQKFQAEQPMCNRKNSRQHNSIKKIKDNTDTSSVTKENTGSRDTEDNVKSTVDTDDNTV